MARKERYLVGLDVGTSKVTAIVGEAGDEGELDIIGIGMADSKGIRRGVVVNLEAAVESIKKAIDEAELTAGVEIDSVHLALSGAHVKAFNSRGVVAVAGKNREITREDVRRALDAAKAVALPSGREILHVLPQDFVVDEQDGIGAPVGMTGSRLEVNVHVVTGSASSSQNVVASVNRAGVGVLDTVLEQLAASDAVLTHDEKELGEGGKAFTSRGEIFDVAIDIRVGSPTFGRTCEFVLSSENKRQVYIPEGFAHGFCVTSERAVVMYKCTDFYAPHAESGVLWNDPDLAIRWPVQTPILSDKDHAYLPLQSIPRDRLPRYSRKGA